MTLSDEQAKQDVVQGATQTCIYLTLREHRC
jgi:hypothetical protein